MHQRSPRHIRNVDPSGWLWRAVAGAFGAMVAPAAGIPSFAWQTAQPGKPCPVGGYGPQLTPSRDDLQRRGRRFKRADVVLYLQTLT